MREQLAGDIVWLGGGVLYAWLMCALAQLAAFAPARARHMAMSVRAKPRCAQGKPPAREYGVATVICFALLLTLPPGVLACGVAHTADSAVMVVAGAVAGMWTGIRLNVGARVRVRVTAVAGCVGGLAALGGGFTWFLAPAEPDLLEQRAALYLAVALGALLIGAAASALCGEMRTRPRLPLTAGSRMVYVVALLLGIALGYGFATASAGSESGLAALAGASVLGAAFGARLMTDAMTGVMTGMTKSAAMSVTRPPRVTRFTFSRHASGGRPSTGVGFAQPSFAGVPDELLVEACGSGYFEPDCLYARVASSEGAASAVHHVSRDLPRRRRSRHRATKHKQGAL